MERENKHGPMMDEALKHESEPIIRGSGESRADEGRLQEETVTRSIDGSDPYEERSNIARFLDPSIFPADSAAIVQNARDNNALDWVVERLSSLPDGEGFENLEAVWEALGGAPEKRF